MSNPLTDTIAELREAMARATDDDLSDDGRYFHDSCNDLTKCGHGDTGEYQHSADGKLVELLWKNRKSFLAALTERETLLARIEALEGALEPFALIATLEERAEADASVMANVRLCRHARTLLTTGGRHEQG